MSNPPKSGRRQDNRRNATERRSNADRRRASDNRNVVFEVCRSTLHVALLVGGNENEPTRVVTRSLQWRKESTSLFTELGQRELTDAFRTLVNDERLAGSHVRIALGGEFCVTRVISGSTDEVRRELADLEERSNRYLTLGPGRKVLASSIEQIDARHEHALLAVANERTLDALLQVADTVGIHVLTIEPSLVALGRAQASLRGGCQDACLIIQLDDRRAELGICHGGRLLVDYRPGGKTDATNVAGVLAQHLTRLQRNIARTHTHLEAPIRQVYLAGEMPAVAEAAKRFAPFKQFKVDVLDPSQIAANWQVVGELPGPEMAAALGTALVEGRPEIEKCSPNLMERVFAQSRVPMRPLLIRSLTPIAAVVLVAFGLLGLFVHERVATNSVRAELDDMSVVRARARELQLNMMAADLMVAQLTALANQLPQPNWGQLLTRIAQSMPDDVWLDSLVLHDAKNMSLTGSSYADGGVYDFVGHLKKVPDVDDVALEGTGLGQSPTGPTTSFDLKLSVVEPEKLNDYEGQR